MTNARTADVSDRIVDDDFANAVWAAAHQNKLGELAELIRSRELGSGERHYLADFIEGKFRRRRGNPNRLKHSEKLRRDEAIARISAFKVERKRAGLPPLSHNEVVDAVALEKRMVPDQL